MTSIFDNENNVIAGLQSQKLVGNIENNLAVATKIAAAAKIETLATGDVFVQQDDLTDEMYFILSGRVDVHINGRLKASREKDEAVGEMSLVDVGGTRSATLTANRPTVLARIENNAFTLIANKHPELWRNIAKCIANRLRQRNERERVKNSKPLVFMASSSEGGSTMEAIEKQISSDDIEVKTWTSDDLFDISTHPIETLESMAKQADFAIIILSEDDEIIFRGEEMFSPRDNVIFEQGIFVGAIGRHRTFVVEYAPKESSKKPFKIPSDYQNLMVHRYTSEENLTSICKKIGQDIERLGTV